MQDRQLKIFTQRFGLPGRFDGKQQRAESPSHDLRRDSRHDAQARMVWVDPMAGDLKRALRGQRVDTADSAVGISLAMPPALSANPSDNPVAARAAVMSLVPVRRASRHPPEHQGTGPAAGS